MIRFIYGDFGCGKTYATVNRIKSDTEKEAQIILIVPEQQVLSTERTLLEILSPSSELFVEVLSFSRLYNRVCREYGGLEYNYITKPAKSLLMWKTVNELVPMLEHYSFGGAGDTSLTEFLISAVGEFKANGIRPTALERASERLGYDNILRSKLRDISLIYSAYNAAVSESFSDSADDISKLADILEKQDFFKGKNVYVDSFTSFTPTEHKVLDRIFATANDVTVTIPLPRECFSSLYTETISASEQRLIRNAKKHGGYEKTELTENMRSESKALSHISKELWELHVTERYNGDGEESVLLERCASPYAEAEAAARRTLELMREGYRCRDIVIIMRDADSYRGIIEPALERCGIPFYISEKSDLASKSAVKFLLSALRIKIYGWRSEDVIAHLKTGLYSIPRSHVDMFESYVKKWTIKGNRFLDGPFTMNPDGYTDTISKRGVSILSAANEVRELLTSRLIPLFTKLDAADNAKEMCLALYEYLADCNLEEKLLSLAAESAAAGDIKEAQEYTALYGIVVDSLALAAETLDDSALSTDGLATALRIVFDNTEIGTIPTSIDQVTLGSASTLRVSSPKCALVLGVCEGEFPKSVSDSGLLNSSEKDLLAELGIEFSSNSDMRSSDELMFVKRSFSLPSERLFIFTHLCGTDGKEKTPSLAYERVKKLLDNVAEHTFDESDLSYLVGSAQDAARYVSTQATTARMESLRSALLGMNDEFSYLDKAEDTPISTEKTSIDPELARQIFPKKMTMSKTKLEKYLECNFGYYCSRVLDLRREDAAAFASLEIGIFVHCILENLINAVIDKRGNGEEPDDDTLELIAERAAEEYLNRICPAFQRQQGRFAHICKRLKSLSLITAKNISDEFSHSEFLPAFTELDIGKDGDALPSLEFLLDDGTKVSMSGAIDRVDLLKKDGRVFVRVVDYKTGSQGFSLEELKLGFNTQMLVYLFSICTAAAIPFLRSKGFETDREPLPAGVVYLSSNISTVDLEDYKDAPSVMKLASEALVRRGVLLRDEEILRSMSDTFSPKVLLGARMTKKNELSGKSLLDIEGFMEVRGQIESVIKDTARDMRNGKADAIPLPHGGRNPCQYCPMKPICRRVEHKKYFNTAEE